MTLKEFMERLGRTDRAKVLSQMRDGIEEMNLVAEVNIKRERLNINKDQRYYNVPADCGRILSIRAKNQNNNDNKYVKVPRLIGDIFESDADGE
jgi:hypothetical protein